MTEKKSEVSSIATKTQNLKLYDELSPVTKEFTAKYRRGWDALTVKPQWRLKRLTEVFGPVGLGWGYQIEERWSEMECAYVRLNLWYRLPGGASERLWTGEQIGGTKFSAGVDDAYKSSVTDALGKCVTHIGLASDIYMGLMDANSEVVERIGDGYIEEIQGLLDETNADEKRFLKIFEVATLSDLTLPQAHRALKMAEDKKAAQDKKKAGDA